MTTNFHTHTTFCDGKNQPEDYVLLAIAKNMHAIGFSAHVPTSYSNDWSMKPDVVTTYFQDISRLKLKYANKIEIYAGFEMDCLITDDRNIIKKYIAMADYTIGSVHYLYDSVQKMFYSVDGSENEVRATFKEFCNGDKREIVRFYYFDLLRVIREYQTNIVGHLDLLKKQNRNNIYFDECDSWYVELIGNVLDEIAVLGTIVEVNTGGMLRSFVQETYPSFWILQEVCKRKIPIIISSDAHCANDIDGYFAEVIPKLRAIGFTKQRILQQGRWADVKL